MKKLYEMKKQTIDIITLAAFAAGEKYLFDKNHRIKIERKYTKPLIGWGRKLIIYVQPNAKYPGETTITAFIEVNDIYNELIASEIENVIEYFLDNNAIQDIESITIW